jgi:hypothetical protein
VPLKGHARIRGGKSQQWLIYPTNPHAAFRPGGGEATPVPCMLVVPSGMMRTGDEVRDRPSGPKTLVPGAILP